MNDPDLGKVLYAEPGECFEQVHVNVRDARDVASVTLAAYLRTLEFVIRAGDDGIENRFFLNRVDHEWPEPTEDLPFPCASILAPDHASHTDANFVPTALDETWHRYAPNTVLWNTGEEQIDLQVDFWCNTPASRTAIASRLPQAFNPYEGRAGVILRGPVDYFAWPLRFTFLGSRRLDTDDSAGARERRLLSTIRADVPILQLRRAVVLGPEIKLEVTD